MPNSTQYKIAIIGPADVVSGFRALGVDTLVAGNADEALAQLKEIKRQSTAGDSDSVYAVVCLIEDLMFGMDEKEYTKTVEGPLPAVVMLPSAKGSQGFAEKRLKQLAEKAVGSAII